MAAGTIAGGRPPVEAISGGRLLVGDRWGCRRAAAGALVDDAAAVRLTSLASRMSVFPVAALAQRWTDATALHADFLCRTSNMAVRRIGSRLVWRYVGLALGRRVGLVRLRVGLVRLRIGGLVQLCSGWCGCVSEKARMGPHCRRRSGVFRLSRIQQTSLTSCFAKTPLVSRIIVLALGPWTPPFRAPLGHFLPIQARQSAMRPHRGIFCRPLLPSAFAETPDWVSAECFCEGLWPGFGSGHACDGSLQGILWSLSHGLLRRLAVNVPQRKSRVCAWARVSSCSAISCLRLD